MSSVLELALEALGSLQEEKRDYMVRNNLGNPTRETNYKLAVTAIAALKEAIKQQGEPFGWYWDNKYEDGIIVNDGQSYDVQPNWVPLYTSAPTIPAALNEFLQKREQDSFSCKRLVADLRVLLAAAPKGEQP